MSLEGMARLQCKLDAANQLLAQVRLERDELRAKQATVAKDARVELLDRVITLVHTFKLSGRLQQLDSADLRALLDL